MTASVTRGGYVARGMDPQDPGRGARAEAPAQTRGDARGAAGERGALWIARGPRAAEEALLSRVDAHAEAVREAARAGGAPHALAAVLAAPVRVVVPSRSLREHLAARLAARRGALAGVVVQTLRRLAAEVLERAGEAPRDGDGVLQVLVRREARREDVLRAELDALRDGYAAVTASVSDLLDAGFEPVHAEAAADALAACVAPAAARARAEAVLRVASRAAQALAALGLSHRAAALARAAERLDDAPDLLPARAVHVHGFADVTGAAGALLDALLRRHGATVILDHPPDPADPALGDLGVAFAERLRRRLVLAGARERPIEAPLPAAATPPAVRLREAPGAEAEARAAARTARELLDAGVAPERIGIVARDLAPFAAPLRRHLRRLAVPFSGAPGAAPVARPGARALHALVVLLRERGEASVDTWLAARAAGGAGRARALARDGAADLRVACHALGVVRLAELAALDVAARLRGREALSLPVRQGLEAVADAAPVAPGRTVRLRRRALAAARLARAAREAGAALAELDALARTQGFAAHRAALARLLEQALRWPRADGPGRAVADALEALGAALPEGFALDGVELALLLARALEGAEAEPLGGAGGGVAVLSVTEARAHTFDALLLLGVGRDAFPRRVVEDALLPDALRRGLESVLPDVPLKARGFDEERYLFAQLVAASPRVFVSWSSASDDGRARAPSPFAERLRLAGGEPERVCAAWTDEDAAGPALRPAYEHAVLAALRGGPGARDAALALALAEARAVEGAFGGPAPEAVAAARRAAREAWDGAPGAPPLGPFLGFTGRRRPAAEPVFVTRLEAFARCPWRAFLAHDLGLEPLPDALAWRPGPDPALLGIALHAALEALVRAAVALPERDTLDAALAREPQPPRWPPPEAARAVVRDAVAEVLEARGVALPGYAEALAQALEPALARARAALGPTPGVVGVEAVGEVAIPAVPGAPGLRLRFRADLVERPAPGAPPILTDWKSGRPAVDASSAAARRAALADALESGLLLQALTYAHAAPGATGRYLFLHEGAAEDARELALRADDPALVQRYREALGDLVAARDAGLHPPRLLARDGRAPAKACGGCELREACAHGDPRARARLRAWLAAAPAPAGGEPAGAGADARLRALWARGPA